ncbi:hypothetical protein TPA0909_70690 [Streptomyces albus]|nr:hypothetical protein TPA0909_70690 [Streptomyces albus]
MLLGWRQLRSAAAAADAGCPGNDGPVIDPVTGIQSLRAFRADGQRPPANSRSSKAPGQAA